MTCQSYPPPNRKCMKAIFARSVFDSVGNPTIEVDLITDLGLFRTAVPSGTTTGEYTALELRDNNPKDFHGKGVNLAIENINTIIGPELVKQEFDVTEQEKIDQFLIDLDGTENKSKFGSNSLLSISIVVCKAGAAKRGIPLYKHIADLAGIKDIVLPVPAFNVICGGISAGNKIPYQEFMILPTGATSFAEAMKMGSETYHHLYNAIRAKSGEADIKVGYDGAFSASKLKTANEALQYLVKAINTAGYTGRIEIAIDMAATEYFKKGKYDLNFKNPKSDPKKFKTPADLLKEYQKMLKAFPIVSIEDPYEKNDFPSWNHLLNKVDIQIVGGDLIVSNVQRLQRAIEEKSCNCLILKLTQIGTVTEAIKTHLLAKENYWGTIISNTAGDTEDSFIADLVVGLSTGQIKTGAPCRSERVAKYNQILRIEEELGKDVRYAGKAFRRPL